MAKQKIDLPSTDDLINSKIPTPGFQEHQRFAKSIQNEIVQSMSIPAKLLGDLPAVEEEYVSTNMVHMHTPNRADTKITRSQALSLMEKLRKLQDEGATLKDGSPIRNKSDVVRWMIEQPLAPIR